MHKFAVVHKPSGIVCYSSNRENHCVAPSYLYSIVSTESASDFTIITPDLSFNNYAEIADALNSSDKFVFSTDADDNLTISDNARSIVIPALLFKETCLDVEETALGDVGELMEDYGFNRDCTELLAHNAVKFWTAARLLELSQETNADNADNADTTTEGEEMTETTPESKEMSTITPVKKFVLKFDLSAARPSVVCESTGFHSELYGDHTLSCATHVKNLLIRHFIAREESADYDNKQQQQQTIWVYDMNNTNITATVYRAPRIDFKPHACDFETMSNALTQSKIGATFFDNQIVKHIESVGINPTRENVRVYRNAYKDQISKLLLSEMLEKRTLVHVSRWFDKINGNSYFSVSVTDGLYQLNIPMQSGYGDAKHLVMRALELEYPRNMTTREYLESLGMTVVDNGYCLKREMFTAAFHI